jgi:subtilase family serine protease
MKGMSFSFARFNLIRIVTSTLVMSLGLAGLGHAQLSGERENVPHWAVPEKRVDSASDSQRVTIVAFLSFRNQAGLKNLIAAQSTPGSSQYGKYLTPEEFHAQFSPKAADVQRVQRTLEKLGFHVDSTPTSGLFVKASGSVAQVKNSFGVSQELYAYKGKILRANAETPRIPAAMSDVVSYVAGLDQTFLLRQPNHRLINERESEAAAALSHSALIANSAVAPNAPPPVAANLPSVVCSNYWGEHSAILATAPGPYPQTLPWLVCGYDPQQVRAAYGSDRVSEDGSGVRVGIVDLYASPTIQDDVNRYSKNHGLPKLTHHNFRQIVPPGLFDVPANDPCGPQGWYGEQSLDFDAVHSMAPGASIIYSATACTDPGNGGLYELIDNHLADIVTNSYGYNGESLPTAFLNAENQFFMQAAAEGMSILFSSGDSGDLAAINGYASGSWEATSPYVTAVGGTSLALFDSSGTKKEWGWGTYRVSMLGVTVAADGKTIATTGPALPFAFYAGSGGGPSVVMPAPAYQADVPYSLSGFTILADGTVVPLNAAYRVTPDISMVGDPYTGFLYGETFTIAGNPVSDAGCTPISATLEYCEGSIGGTSLSSPLFAGVLALVNQARFQSHKGPVGFVNPALYQLGHGGDDESESAPIVDVKKPHSPTAVLRGYLGNPNKLRIVTMNSTANPNYVPDGEDGQSPVLEGTDTSYLTTRGYDEVTGLGTPNVPALIRAFERF